MGDHKLPVSGKNARRIAKISMKLLRVFSYVKQKLSFVWKHKIYLLSFITLVAAYYIAVYIASKRETSDNADTDVVENVY